MDRLEIAGRALDGVIGPLFALAWLLGAALVWLALGARRARREGAGARPLLLLGAGMAGLVVLLGLTLAGFAGRAPSGVRLAHFARAALPHYAALAAVLMTALATRRLLRGAPGRLALLLVALLVVPSAIVLLGRPRLDELVKHVLRDPAASRLAVPPPPEPIRPPAHPGMVLVPAGPFVQGSLSPLQLQKIVGNAEGDEHPVRSRWLDAFLIDETEVTNAAFARFVEATGHVTDAERLGTGTRWDATGFHIEPGLTWRTPGGPGDSIAGRAAHPVVQVSWNDARAYCAWAGKRLPSEAEWEKAARGPDARAFPWGDAFDPTRTNYCDRACDDLPQHRDAAGRDGFRRTAPVGSFPAGASPYGALDMAGNVWEWVEDAYDPHYYAVAPSFDPRGPASDAARVVRGGSFTSEPGYTRTSSRSYDPPTEAFFGIGFRCARDPDEPTTR